MSCARNQTTTHLTRSGTRFIGSWSLSGTDDEVGANGCDDSRFAPFLETWSGSGQFVGADVEPSTNEPELSFGLLNSEPSLVITVPAMVSVQPPSECPGSAAPSPLRGSAV